MSDPGAKPISLGSRSVIFPLFNSDSFAVVDLAHHLGWKEYGTGILSQKICTASSELSPAVQWDSHFGFLDLWLQTLWKDSLLVQISTS